MLVKALIGLIFLKKMIVVSPMCIIQLRRLGLFSLNNRQEVQLNCLGLDVSIGHHEKVLKVHELWVPTALLPLDQNECLAPHLKILIISMWSRRIKALALLLGHFMNTQINLISYHKMRIVPVSLRLTVYVMIWFVTLQKETETREMKKQMRCSLILILTNYLKDCSKN